MNQGVEKLIEEKDQFRRILLLALALYSGKTESNNILECSESNICYFDSVFVEFYLETTYFFKELNQLHRSITLGNQQDLNFVVETYLDYLDNLIPSVSATKD